MKLAVAALSLLGVAAALCAAFLVNTLRANVVVVAPPTTAPTEQPMVSVLYATTGIPAMTVVDAKSVIVKSISKNEAPKDYITSPVDVVGKVVGTAVVEGQAFTPSIFADKPTARQVADAIPFGKRAVGISVTDYAGLEGMLFPGSTVDVMVTFKPQDGDWEKAVTATLIENIQVLGIEQQTVVSPNHSDDSQYNLNRGSARRVTLLVDTEQAQKLQVAMGYGTLSLALRNPLDGSKSTGASVSVKGLMDDLSPLRMLDNDPTTRPVAPPVAAVANDPFAAAPPTTKPAEPERWEVTIIRGDTVETKSFPMPKPADKPVEAINSNR